MSVELKPGWLQRQFRNVDEEVAQWPERMKQAAGFSREGGMSTAREREQAIIAGFDSVEEMIQAQTLEAITEAAAKIREQDATIASRDAEIESLNLDLSQALRIGVSHMEKAERQAAQIQTLREALEAALCVENCLSRTKHYPNEPAYQAPVCRSMFGCGACSRCSYRARNAPVSRPCNCWKSAALAQVSASTEEGQ